MNIASYLSKILLVSLCYFALGHIGFFFKIVSSNSTIFWPPAGLALAAILLYGNRIWPGILLGAIATTLSHYSTPFSMSHISLAVLTAGGATLQAVLSGYFVRSFCTSPYRLEDIKEISLLIILGGFIGCAVSTTIGNGALHYHELISFSALAPSWLSWYVGDVIGVILLCPFILILFGSTKEISSTRKEIVCSVLTLLFILVGTLFFFIQAWEKDKQTALFNERSNNLAYELRKELSVYPEILAAIEDLFASSEEVTLEEFETFTNRFLKLHPQIMALSWNPKIVNTDRTAFEQAMRHQGFSAFHIKDRASLEKLTRASSRPFYFPVTYTLPFERNQKAHGFDAYGVDNYSGIQRRRTLDQARLTGKPYTTGRISVVQSDNPASYIIYHPIYHNRTLPFPKRAEISNLWGYAAVVLEIDKMLERISAEAEKTGMSLVINDRSSSVRDRLFYDARQHIKEKSEVEENALKHQSFYDYTGRGLEINFIQSLHDLRSHAPVLVWGSFIASLLMTGLLSVLTLIVSGNSESIKRIIRKKTKELSEFGDIVENAVNEIYIFDASSLQFLHTNESAQKNLGYSEDELLELGPLNIKPEYNEQKFLNLVAPLLDGTEDKIIFRADHLRKDSTRYDAEIHLQKTVYLGTEALLAFVTDISEQVKAETALKLQQHDMQLIFNNLPVRIWYKDDKNKILRLNKAAAKSMGGEVSDFEGKNTYDLFPEMAKKYHDDDLEVIDSGTAKLEIVEEYTPKDGELGWVYTDKVPYHDEENDRKGVFVVAQDITALKLAEEQLEEVVERLTESNQELERFAYVASHDLQEPLRMVRNFTELLENRYANELDETAKIYITIASESAKHMQELVDDLLDYARIEQGEEKLEIIDPQHTLDYVKTTLHETITHHKAEISNDPLPAVTVNPVSFSSAIQNLITNALKYKSPDRVPKIHVGAKESEEEWVFSVNDNGIGIKEEYHEQIFKPFKRLHTKEEYKGTGMGLAICRKTIESFGGRIWVESQHGVGTTFFFTVPKQDWE